METISTQQEILLLTDTSFSKRRWSEKEMQADQNVRDELLRACWNGVLKETLPEIFEKTSSGQELFLWQISEGESFLELDLRERPSALEKNHSINPYIFLLTQCYN